MTPSRRQKWRQSAAALCMADQQQHQPAGIDMHGVDIIVERLHRADEAGTQEMPSSSAVSQ